MCVAFRYKHTLTLETSSLVSLKILGLFCGLCDNEDKVYFMYFCRSKFFICSFLFLDQMISLFFIHSAGQRSSRLHCYVVLVYKELITVICGTCFTTAKVFFWPGLRPEIPPTPLSGLVSLGLALPPL